MKYISTVKNSDLVGDILQVQVEFRSEDGTRIINDSFSTKSGQDSDWLEKNITRKMAELEGLDALSESISLGEFAVEAKESVPLTAKDEYKADLDKFNTWVSAIRKGVTTQDNTEFVALQQKLKDNFSSEYLDLI